MKLSFSTKGWHNRSFEDFCEIAKDFGFEGIELHHIHNPLFLIFPFIISASLALEYV